MKQFFLLILALITLSSCLSEAPPPDPQAATPGAAVSDDAPRRVTLSFAVQQEEQALYQPLVERFMRDHPDIAITFVSLDQLMNAPEPSAGAQPFGLLSAVVQGADVAPAFVAPPSAYGSNLLLNLRPLMEADASFQPSDFSAGALDQFSSAGGLWGVPQSLQLPLLTYNRALFSAAGIAAPKPGWSAADLLALAEQISAGGSRSGATYGLLDPTGGVLRARKSARRCWTSRR